MAKIVPPALFGVRDSHSLSSTSTTSEQQSQSQQCSNQSSTLEQCAAGVEAV